MKQCDKLFCILFFLLIFPIFFFSTFLVNNIPGIHSYEKNHKYYINHGIFVVWLDVIITRHKHILSSSVDLIKKKTHSQHDDGFVRLCLCIQFQLWQGVARITPRWYVILINMQCSITIVRHSRHCESKYPRKNMKLVWCDGFLLSLPVCLSLEISL